jgi:hypothetical protein
MSIIDPPKSRFLFGLIVGAAIGAAGAALWETLSFRKPQTLSASYQIEGYDFSGLRNPEKVWRGPQVGEKINLANLLEENGSTLEHKIEQRPIMIATISPSCAFCKIARDEMQYVQGQIALKNIGYYLVSFAPPVTDSDFYRYCERLKIGASSFQWSRDAAPAQEALSRMVTPSHLLVDRDGTVLRVWPGTSAEQPVRDSMGRQIVSDVSVILDTLEAREQSAQNAVTTLRRP